MPEADWRNYTWNTLSAAEKAELLKEMKAQSTKTTGKPPAAFDYDLLFPGKGEKPDA